MIEFKVTGFAELKKFLDTFPDKIQQECERKATAAGAAIVWEAARINYNNRSITQRTGRTRKNIKMRKLAGSNKWEVHYGVGISRYGMFLELGTQKHVIKAENKKVLATKSVTLGIAGSAGGALKGDRTIETEYGFIGKQVEVSAAARPFLRPAFYANTKRIIEAERQVLSRLINSEIMRRSGLMNFLRSR